MSIIATAAVPGGVNLSAVDTGEIPRAEGHDVPQLLAMAELAAYRHGRQHAEEKLAEYADKGDMIRLVELAELLELGRRLATIPDSSVGHAYVDGFASVLGDQLAAYHGDDQRGRDVLEAVEQIITAATAEWESRNPGPWVGGREIAEETVDAVAEPTVTGWRAAAVMFPQHADLFRRLADVVEARRILGLPLTADSERSGGAR